jgi:hypothetical protein
LKRPVSSNGNTGRKAQPTNGWAIKGVTGLEQAIYFTAKDRISKHRRGITFVMQQTSGSNQVLGRFRLAATTNRRRSRAKAALPRAPKWRTPQYPQGQAHRGTGTKLAVISEAPRLS